MKRTLRVILTGCMVLLLSFSSLKTDYAEAASTNSNVELNVTKALLFVGDTLQLDLNGINKKVTWSSSDKRVASVSKKGNVKAKSEGSTIIIAKTGKKTYKCKVNVKEITGEIVFSSNCVVPSINTLQFSTKEVRKYNNGSYEVDAYIYNGFSHSVFNINVTGMTLYDRYDNQIASATFGNCSDLVISGNTYVVWTFQFTKELTNTGDFDFSRIGLYVTCKNNY